MATNQKTDRAATAAETTNGTTATSKKSNFGNFAYTVTCELTNEQVETILAEGLLHIAQRAPASRVEKTLAGYKNRIDMGDDWTRDQIDYTEEKARQFEVEMAREFEKVAHIKVQSVSADHYTPETRPVAYADAKQVIKTALANKTLLKLVKDVGFKGDVTAETALENAEFIQAVDTERRARIKTMFPVA
jgi:hypothetical protein